MYFIFRKSDGVVLYESHSLDQYENEKKACLISEGGSESDYLFLTGTTSTPPGKIATVSASGEVRFVDDPIATAEQKAKNVLSEKLRKLGLDDLDLSALGITALKN